MTAENKNLSRRKLLKAGAIGRSCGRAGSLRLDPRDRNLRKRYLHRRLVGLRN